MSTRTLPTVFALTRAQRDGTRCVWDGKPLHGGGVPAGIAVGYWGAHNLSVTVYACPTACDQTDTPSTGDAS
jgi:hypothetical protein